MSDLWSTMGPILFKVALVSVISQISLLYIYFICQTMFTKFVLFWPPYPLRVHFLWYKKSLFLTTYPPPLVNVVCERPLMGINKKASKNPQNVVKIFLKVALHLVHSNCFYQKIILNFYMSSCRGCATLKKTDELGINAPISWKRRIQNTVFP